MARKAKPRPALTGVASAERVLAVLTAYRRGDETLTLAELAERTGLVKSTIMRMAISLEQYGLVIRTLDGGYRLGGETMRLGRIYEEGLGLEIQIRPVLQSLAHRTEETSSFWILQGDQRMCLYRENSPQALRLDVQPGTLRALDKSSSGQVLQIFGVDMPSKSKMPALPIYSSGAHTPHVASMSTPVFGATGLVGALALSGPSARLTRDRAREVGPVLLRAAVDLSRSLGGHQNPVYRGEPAAA